MGRVETDGCSADRIPVATGCWLGRRTLQLVDTARVAATFVETQSGRFVRVRPHPRARTLALAWAPHAPDRWQAQLRAYQHMPAAELLQVEPIRLTMPIDAIVGQPGVRVACARCGEEILNWRELHTAAGVKCVLCSGHP